MSGIFLKMMKAAIIATVLVIFTGCTYNPAVVSAVAEKPAELSAWLAYWDLDAGEKDLKRMDRNLTKLSYFGAYFDKNDHLFIPVELTDKKRQLGKMKGKYETYLTFVNDKENPDGSVVVKDIEVLRRIFASDSSMKKHIDNIIALTVQGGYDGIEIDYEKIWKDKKIGLSFLNFTEELYAKALQNHLKVRIILEPMAPFDFADFGKGPEYVVMFYNLYGLHSGPGPKANKEFIRKTLERMENLPSERSIAFSTGGCVWASNGKKSFLTEAEAKTLAVTNEAETKRDEESQCILFEYKDSKGVSYQVWYADEKTLNYWISIAQEQGQSNISLWRLGGNVDIDKIK